MENFNKEAQLHALYKLFKRKLIELLIYISIPQNSPTVYLEDFFDDIPSVSRYISTVGEKDSAPIFLTKRSVDNNKTNVKINTRTNDKENEKIKEVNEEKQKEKEKDKEGEKIEEKKEEEKIGEKKEEEKIEEKKEEEKIEEKKAVEKESGTNKKTDVGVGKIAKEETKAANEATDKEKESKKTKLNLETPFYLNNLMVYLCSLIVSNLSYVELMDICINRREFKKCGFYACNNKFVSDPVGSIYKLNAKERVIHRRDYVHMFCSTHCMNYNLSVINLIKSEKKNEKKIEDIKNNCILIYVLFQSYFPYFKFYDFTFLMNNLDKMKIKHGKIYFPKEVLKEQRNMSVQGNSKMNLGNSSNSISEKTKDNNNCSHTRNIPNHNEPVFTGCDNPSILSSRQTNMSVQENNKMNLGNSSNSISEKTKDNNNRGYVAGLFSPRGVLYAEVGIPSIVFSKKTVVSVGEDIKMKFGIFNSSISEKTKDNNNCSYTLNVPNHSEPISTGCGNPFILSGTQTNMSVQENNKMNLGNSINSISEKTKDNNNCGYTLNVPNQSDPVFAGCGNPSVLSGVVDNLSSVDSFNLGNNLHHLDMIKHKCDTGNPEKMYGANYNTAEKIVNDSHSSSDSAILPKNVIPRQQNFSKLRYVDSVGKHSKKRISNVLKNTSNLNGPFSRLSNKKYEVNLSDSEDHMNIREIIFVSKDEGETTTERKLIVNQPTSPTDKNLPGAMTSLKILGQINKKGILKNEEKKENSSLIQNKRKVQFNIKETKCFRYAKHGNVTNVIVQDINSNPKERRAKIGIIKTKKGFKRIKDMRPYYDIIPVPLPHYKVDFNKNVENVNERQNNNSIESYENGNANYTSILSVEQIKEGICSKEQSKKTLPMKDENNLKKKKKQKEEVKEKKSCAPIMVKQCNLNKGKNVSVIIPSLQNNGSDEFQQMEQESEKPLRHILMNQNYPENCEDFVFKLNVTPNTDMLSSVTQNEGMSILDYENGAHKKKSSNKNDSAKEHEEDRDSGSGSGSGSGSDSDINMESAGTDIKDSGKPSFYDGNSRKGKKRRKKLPNEVKYLNTDSLSRCTGLINFDYNSEGSERKELNQIEQNGAAPNEQKVTSKFNFPNEENKDDIKKVNGEEKINVQGIPHSAMKQELKNMPQGDKTEEKEQTEKIQLKGHREPIEEKETGTIIENTVSENSLVKKYDAEETEINEQGRLRLLMEKKQKFWEQLYNNAFISAYMYSVYCNNYNDAKMKKKKKKKKEKTEEQKRDEISGQGANLCPQKDVPPNLNVNVIKNSGGDNKGVKRHEGMDNDGNGDKSKRHMKQLKLEKFVSVSPNVCAYEGLSLFSLLWNFLSSAISEYTIQFFKQKKFELPEALNEKERKRKFICLRNVDTFMPRFFIPISSTILDVFNTFYFRSFSMAYRRTFYRCLICLIVYMLSLRREDCLQGNKNVYKKKAEKYLIEKKQLDTIHIEELILLFDKILP